MKAGELKHEITFEQPSEAQSSSGAISNTWDQVCVVRAKIEPQGGSEMFAGAVFNPEATHKITIRFWPGLVPTMRINFKGRLFNILNVNNYLERNIWLEILAKEGPSYGVV